MSDDYFIMGVDPGASGALAFYNPKFPKLIAAYDMPIIGKELNAAELFDIIDSFKPVVAVIEAVHAMPKQGLSSTFNFGVSYGVIRGVVGAAKIRTHLVTPTKWKKYFSLPAEKDASRALAVRHWPDSPHFRRKKDHGRAEAALLALYGDAIK